ncbi:Sensors of blue-light using FAD [Pseudovibrio denitrificans]|uniref:Sensors of blue-light using FAD n=2 Tax=Pseudovibrio TaxID=258255 RepID=A0A1I6Y7S9_9HYPH|nr:MULTISPECIES: BLUF domain-containing protein [Pseudovibrio]QUS57401.1 BLUF domain-containing protein [Pseudovibrio brasiliensis]SFT46575.1 Sensors of blue-light using FAD [Pseudovibrio denitrificans]
MSVTQLCYRSRIHWPALRHSLDEEVERSLTRIRRINSMAGVTGALILTDNHVFQLLEGPWPSVKRTFECVLEDRRHSDLTVLSNEEQDFRLFHNCWMHFCDLREEADSHYPKFFGNLLAHPDRTCSEEVMELLLLLSMNMSESQLTSRIALM